MEHEPLRKLTAAFSELSSEEMEALASHLPACAQCREELAVLQEAAAVLGSSTRIHPPQGLRARVLERVRQEHALKRRSAHRAGVAWGVAAAATAVAIGIGAWTVSPSASLADERMASGRGAAAVQAHARPGAEAIPLEGADGNLVIAPEGAATLVIAGLPAAPENRTYEAWVDVGGDLRPAGLFDGGEGQAVHALTRPVPPGASVLVSLEPESGSSRITGRPLLQAGRP